MATTLNMVRLRRPLSSCRLTSSGSRAVVAVLYTLAVVDLFAATHAFGDPAIDSLVAVYPAHLAGSDGQNLIWRDGTRMPYSDGRRDKSFEELLASPTIKDQFAYRYSLGPAKKPPGVNEDPGRIRYEPFFLKMYGDCRRGEVARRLKTIPWLPRRGGGSIQATTINGVADQLAAISKELDTLPAELTRFMIPSAGAYNCRSVRHTQRLSMHAYGAAIDLNERYADYWLWKKPSHRFVLKNRIPQAIVDVFERHGFIWGGKWFHYDTMHFEYRPELIFLAKQGWPEK